MTKLEEVRKILKDKLIIRIDHQYNEKDYSNDYILIFINPEKKQMGHVLVKIKDSLKSNEEMKIFKSILDKNFDKSIKGFKNWKKIIRSY